MEKLHPARFRPNKLRGQNFLTDEDAASRIVHFAAVTSTDQVIEVGPGRGALTSILLSINPSLIVVEIEETLCRELAINISGLNPAKIICSDVRRIALRNVIGDNKCVIVSNVPYSISTDFVLWCFENRRHIARASLLLQREFAERLAAEPHSRAYGTLSVFRKRFASAQLGEIFPGTIFSPKAAVESRLIELVFDKQEDDIDNAAFKQFIVGCFCQKRKTLLNALTASGLFTSKEDVQHFLAQWNLPPPIRAEEIDLPLFLNMFRCWQAKDR